ncbi:sterol 26-hydroxylase, mitochondrial-like [Mytilus trossulus]|uniref:sterol 26-hydroxylase, mitochondrial-like n=1 Tax=Mytilus trossulus TaxID=6551 RepID=UPI0030055830
MHLIKRTSLLVKIHCRCDKLRCVTRYSTATATSQSTLQDEDIKPFHQMPGPKGLYTVPYLGSALQFKPFTPYTIDDIITVIENNKNKYGDIMRLRLGKDFVVYISHPDLAKVVFQYPYQEHVRVGLGILEIYHKRTGVKKGLSLLQGEEWLALRRPAQEKMLKPSVVADYVPMIGNVTNDFVKRLRQQKTVPDLLEELMKYTTESVGMLCFNKRLGCFESSSNTRLIKALEDMFTTMQQAFLLPFPTYNFYRTKLYKTFERSLQVLDEVAHKEINDQVMVLKKLEEDGKLDDYLSKDPNFMHSLLSDPRMAKEDVVGLVTSLFGGGIDSTANGMAFVLTDLALNQDKQELLNKEIQEVLGDQQTVTKEHLSKMSYLKACVKESQRKIFPVLFGAARITENDMIVGGYQIPKNMLVILNNNCMCNDERFYPNPKEYIPERWMRKYKDEAIAKGQDYPFGFKPFGFGPRGCVGQRFAENEIYIGVAKIIQNFKISMPPGVEEVKHVNRIFTSPLEKVTVHFTDRKQIPST